MRLKKILIISGLTLAVLLAGAAGFVLWQQHDMDSLVAQKAHAVLDLAKKTPPVVWNESSITKLPLPVQRYFKFTAPQGLRPLRAVRMKLAGEFRRPGQEGWEPATAEQYVSVNQPAYVFSQTVRMLPGVWADAMDAYVDGNMHMEARLLSAITLVKKKDNPKLNNTSIMRFFIEAPLFPHALLPGKQLTWQPIDDRTARAVIKTQAGVGAYRVSFDQKGRILRYDMEREEGVNQDYHGAGEHAKRSEYKLVNGYMLPTKFEIARVIDGQINPFWRGRVVSLEYDPFEMYP